MAFLAIDVQEVADVQRGGRLEQGCGVAGFADSDYGVSEFRAAFSFPGGDLPKRGARGRTVCRPQIEMRVEVENAEALGRPAGRCGRDRGRSRTPSRGRRRALAEGFRRRAASRPARRDFLAPPPVRRLPRRHPRVLDHELRPDRERRQRCANRGRSRLRSRPSAIAPDPGVAGEPDQRNAGAAGGFVDGVMPSAMFRPGPSSRPVHWVVLTCAPAIG